jgi:hypothetical protein
MDIKPNFEQICISGPDPRTTGGLDRWHGRNSWLYLDGRKINGVPCPLVNLGHGCPISLAEAVTLPFEIMGQDATPDQIAADFHAVSRAPFNFRPDGYENYSVCRLPEEEIDRLTKKRFATLIVVLRHLFPQFEEWPEHAKAGALDLFYAHDLAVAVTYFSLLEALKVRDFNLAARRCREDMMVPAFLVRNAARAKLFVEAGKAIA